MSSSVVPPRGPGRVGAIVLGAGLSERMGGVDKIFTLIRGVPLIAHSIDTLDACGIVNEIVLVCHPDNLKHGQDLARQRGWQHVSSVCAGGERRQDSVRLGLSQLAPCQWVVVHDGARPCIDAEMVQQGLEAARETGAAIAAVPAVDTIKVVSPDRVVQSTLDRRTLWMVQTPQVFRYDILMEAHRQTVANVTDDAAMVESTGHRVKVYMGSYSNLKVTTPEDLHIVERALQATAFARHS